MAQRFKLHYVFSGEVLLCIGKTSINDLMKCFLTILLPNFYELFCLVRFIFFHTWVSGELRCIVLDLDASHCKMCYKLYGWIRRSPNANFATQNFNVFAISPPDAILQLHQQLTVEMLSDIYQKALYL